MFVSRSGAVKLSLALIVGLVILKLVVAVVTESIGISAQTVDSFIDLLAVVLILPAVTMANIPADEGHPFGHGKMEGIAATGQAVLLLTAASLIIYSAVRRIIAGATIELAEAGIGVMLVSILVSILLSRHLIKVSRATDSIALEALARNIAADVYSASGVLVTLVVIRFTKINILDPIIALGVSCLILKAAYDVMRKSFRELVDVSLPKAEEDLIISCITEHTTQLAGFHQMRTRKAGSQRFIDLHLMLPKNASVEEADYMCDHLESDLANRLPNSSITIHVEPCDMVCQQCSVRPCTLRKGDLS